MGIVASLSIPAMARYMPSTGDGKAVRIDFLGDFVIDICAAINWSWLACRRHRNRDAWSVAGDPHMNFSRARISHHCDDLARRVPRTIESSTRTTRFPRTVAEGVMLQLHRVRRSFCVGWKNVRPT